LPAISRNKVPKSKIKKQQVKDWTSYFFSFSKDTSTNKNMRNKKMLCYII